jgi:glycosyltransferase involved in cell wall biosynthesis
VARIGPEQRDPFRWKHWRALYRGLFAAMLFALVTGLLGFPSVSDKTDSDVSAADVVDDGHEKHRVSVVIPTHNRADQLEVAVRSVLESPLISAPSQIIVVDDDSDDHTPEVVRRLGVSYVPIAGHSAAHSRNAGWRRAGTEFVTFLDDDDAWLPGNLEEQLDALETHPRAGFAYGIARCATEQDLEPIASTFPVPPLASGHVPERLHGRYPQLGVVLFRRQALEEVDGFDPRVNYWEDADLMIRVAARREIVGVEREGMLYRLRYPCRERADYFWPLRDVARWRPKGAGVGWRPALRFEISTKGLFFTRFVEDAGACVDAGHNLDALVCVARAAWVSPFHAIRHRKFLLTPVRRLMSAVLQS